MIKRSFAPEPVMLAALDVVGQACVAVRNASLSPDADLKMINDIVEAVHDIPSQLKTWDESRLSTLRIHLKCFDSARYPGSVNLSERFEMLLAGYEAELE